MDEQLVVGDIYNERLLDYLLLYHTIEPFYWTHWGQHFHMWFHMYFPEPKLHNHISIKSSMKIVLRSQIDNKSSLYIMILLWLWEKLQNDWTTETDVMDKQNFARVEFKMSFGWISYITRHPWCWSGAPDLFQHQFQMAEHHIFRINKTIGTVPSIFLYFHLSNFKLLMIKHFMGTFYNITNYI